MGSDSMTTVSELFSWAAVAFACFQKGIGSLDGFISSSFRSSAYILVGFHGLIAQFDRAIFDHSPGFLSGLGGKQERCNSTSDTTNYKTNQKRTKIITVRHFNSPFG